MLNDGAYQRDQTRTICRTGVDPLSTAANLAISNA